MRKERAQIAERLAADSASAAERIARLEAELCREAQRAGRAEADLTAFRGDASRQLQAAGERESALLATLQQIYASTSWRTLSRWWRFKAKLLGR